MIFPSALCLKKCEGLLSPILGSFLPLIKWAVWFLMAYYQCLQMCCPKRRRRFNNKYLCHGLCCSSRSVSEGDLSIPELPHQPRGSYISAEYLPEIGVFGEELCDLPKFPTGDDSPKYENVEFPCASDIVARVSHLSKSQTQKEKFCRRWYALQSKKIGRNGYIEDARFVFLIFTLLRALMLFEEVFCS